MFMHIYSSASIKAEQFIRWRWQKDKYTYMYEHNNIYILKVTLNFQFGSLLSIMGGLGNNQMERRVNIHYTYT